MAAHQSPGHEVNGTIKFGALPVPIDEFKPVEAFAVTVQVEELVELPEHFAQGSGIITLQCGWEDDSNNRQTAKFFDAGSAGGNGIQIGKGKRQAANIQVGKSFKLEGGQQHCNIYLAVSKLNSVSKGEETPLVGTCTIDALDRAQHSSQNHPLVYHNGQPFGGFVRLSVRVEHQVGGSPQFPLSPASSQQYSPQPASTIHSPGLLSSAQLEHKLEAAEQTKAHLETQLERVVRAQEFDIQRATEMDEKVDELERRNRELSDTNRKLSRDKISLEERVQEVSDEFSEAKQHGTRQSEMKKRVMFEPSVAELQSELDGASARIHQEQSLYNEAKSRAADLRSRMECFEDEAHENDERYDKERNKVRALQDRVLKLTEALEAQWIELENARKVPSSYPSEGDHHNLGGSLGNELSDSAAMQPILEALHKEVQQLKARLAASENAAGGRAAKEVEASGSQRDLAELREHLELAKQALGQGGKRTLIIAVEELQAQRAELRQEISLESQACHRAEMEHLQTLAAITDVNRLHMVSVERRRLKARNPRDGKPTEARTSESGAGNFVSW